MGGPGRKRAAQKGSRFFPINYLRTIISLNIIKIIHREGFLIVSHVNALFVVCYKVYRKWVLLTPFLQYQNIPHPNPFARYHSS